MFSKCFILLFFSAFVDAQYPYHYRVQQCPYPQLEHGKVRIRQRPKLVKFMCLLRYELVGHRYATCRNGEWDVPLPVCVKPGCPELPTPQNAIHLKNHHGAFIVTFCMSGYKLTGPSAIYCNGYKWNATAPKCIDSSIETSLSCDFENPNMCGWTQDELHDFDWKRINTKTPSSFLLTGPSYDHTLGKGQAGYYMYIESTSKLENNTARLLSPIFDAHLSVNGCFSFFYHMYGQAIGGLKIYQKPDRVQMDEMVNMTSSDKEQYVLFEQWGNLGDFWYSAAPQLKDFHDNFQIVIEGIRGSSFTSDIAIDDVAILQGENCNNFRIAATSPSPIYSETCQGRCNLGGDPEPLNGCECSPRCLATDRCCADFMEVCVFDGNNSSSDPDDASPTSSDEQPQTEKLIGDSTTSTTTTTTERSTTSTRTNPTTKATTSTPKPTSRPPRPTTTRTTSTTAKPTKATIKTTVITVPTLKTTKAPTTTIKVTASQTPVNKTTQITTRKSTPTTIKETTTDFYKEEKGKNDKEVIIQKMAADQPVEKKSSTWKTAVVTIVVLSVFAGLIYLGVASRGTRGIVVLSRLRSRVMGSHDSSVQYLTTNDDDL